jgi:hypothetical protein
MTFPFAEGTSLAPFFGITDRQLSSINEHVLFYLFRDRIGVPPHPCRNIAQRRFSRGEITVMSA